MALTFGTQKTLIDDQCILTALHLLEIAFCDHTDREDTGTDLFLDMAINKERSYRNSGLANYIDVKIADDRAWQIYRDISASASNL